ncbi:DMT family transporter [Streptomyces axinellae]|uniref:DMT family transporter n=1 Tax=Streptomyces axinellae TaxID=552788 RepID=A0ABN3Q2V9_9ACTN
MALLAAIAAMVWGAADYFGARATRGVSAIHIVFLSQVLGLPVLAVWLAASGVGAPTTSSLLWGVCAGAFGLLGMVLLYRALSAYGIVWAAPVTAVTVALVPLVVGLFVQTAPGPLALCGVCCALASIALVNRAAQATRSAIAMRTLALALSAGGALGLQLVCLSQPGPGAGLWPLAGARACSILCAAPLVLRGRVRLDLGGVPWLFVAMAGVLDTAAFAFYLFAMDHGLLGVVGPIVSLYPAATIVLALLFDGERLTRSQALGLCLGASALLLVAV